jgi:hypothetical protein
MNLKPSESMAFEIDLILNQIEARQRRVQAAIFIGVAYDKGGEKL